MAARLHFVKKSRKRHKQGDVIVKKGESYFWWKFKNSPRYISKTKPSRSRLTRSGFLSTAWDIEGDISTTFDSLEEAANHLEEIKSRIEELRDEQEEKRDNMPEQLQESESGTLLQERYDHLDSIVGDLDGVEFEAPDGASEDEIQEVIQAIADALAGISLEP